MGLARLEAMRPPFDGVTEPIEAALEVFRRCEADAWYRLVTAERDRLTAHADDTRLTTAESRVAELVAEGASNRQTAEALYVSVKTIEATLTRIYRKLGIRSRHQLSMLWGPGRQAT